MTPRKLTPGLYIDAQPTPDEIRDLARHGFHGVISNRPDGEEANQPGAGLIERAAREAGLAFVHIPIVPGKITDEHVAAFGEALATMRGPVLAFCKTGTRSTFLWALGEAGRLDPRAIHATAADAGIDVSPLMKKLQTRWEA